MADKTDEFFCPDCRQMFWIVFDADEGRAGFDSSHEPYWQRYAVSPSTARRLLALHRTECGHNEPQSAE